MHGMGFPHFGLLHLGAVAGLTSAIGAMCALGRRLRGSSTGRRYERALALVVALLWIAYQAFDALTYGFDARRSLPLQLCDVAAVVAALAFAWPRRRLHALAYFWGLALSTQAIVTPDLVGGPGTLAFWAFWLYHTFVVGAGVYVVVVRDFRPTRHDLAFAVGVGLVYAAVVFAIDARFDLNYGYLGRATPSQPTLIDHVGAWPGRVVVMVMLAAATMTALWLPWGMAARRRGVAG